MNLRNARAIVVFTAVSLLMAFGPLNSGSSESGNTGINQLIAVAIKKAQSANEEALKGADKQRDLVKKQRSVRDRARETAVLRQLEANASRTAEVLESLKAIDANLRMNPCK